MPCHAVKPIVTLWSRSAVWTINFEDATDWVVMPDGGRGQALDAVSFRGRCFAVAVIVLIMRDFVARIGDVGQVTYMVIGKLRPRSRYSCGGFAPVGIILVSGDDPCPVVCV